MDRDESGRFQPGHGHAGPGRPRGKENKTTIDLRRLRRRIAASWDRVDGDRLLDGLAASDFHAYAKLVLSILPKGVDSASEEQDRIRIYIGHPRGGPPLTDKEIEQMVKSDADMYRESLMHERNRIRDESQRKGEL